MHRNERIKSADLIIISLRFKFKDYSIYNKPRQGGGPPLHRRTGYSMRYHIAPPTLDWLRNHRPPSWASHCSTRVRLEYMPSLGPACAGLSLAGWLPQGVRGRASPNRPYRTRKHRHHKRVAAKVEGVVADADLDAEHVGEILTR